MESEELRFKHVGLSSDEAVIFCAMENGKTYAMPLCALERAESWDPKAKPESVSTVHDGYAAVVRFNTGVAIDFPSDFVLHVCEPPYDWHKDKGRAATGAGDRVREIRQARGLTLDALAAKCGIAKPNLSRLENDKVTPKFETLRAIAAALEIHPALLVQKDAWTWTRSTFDEWKHGLLWNPGSRGEPVNSKRMVTIFLAKYPEHGYARPKLLKHANHAPSHDPDLPEYTLDAEKWSREVTAAKAAKPRAKCGME